MATGYGVKRRRSRLALLSAKTTICWVNFPMSNVCPETRGELPLEAVLDMGGVVKKGVEARRFERYFFRTLATAMIQPLPLIGGETQECFVMTRDLSRGGISFLHPKRLALGQRVDLSFDDGRHFILSVRWVQKIEKRKYVIGCGFIRTGETSQPNAVPPAAEADSTAD
jgi:hypothetical protein